jgi:hypothetical protein
MLTDIIEGTGTTGLKKPLIGSEPHYIEVTALHRSDNRCMIPICNFHITVFIIFKTLLKD